MQITKEKIYFESANPFSLSDIISDLNNQKNKKFLILKPVEN